MIEKPPKHLRPATKAWFSSVLGEYQLESHHIRLLTLAANPGIDVAKHGKRLIHEAEVGVKCT
jgi:hypothetical protein